MVLSWEWHWGLPFIEDSVGFGRVCAQTDSNRFVARGRKTRRFVSFSLAFTHTAKSNEAAGAETATVRRVFLWGARSLGAATEEEVGERVAGAGGERRAERKRTRE